MQYEDLILRLKHYKIPDTTCSFEGAGADQCLCAEETDAGWEVCETIGSEKRVRGVFPCDHLAYDFLFFLVMKQYVPLKKRWWW